MSDVGPGRVSLEAREQMLSMLHRAAPAQGEPSPGAVREEIVASWRRSIEHGVRLDALDVPYDADAAADDTLTHAARPVADAIAGDLDGTGVGLLLADGEACIIDRRVPDRGLLDNLDRMSLAPGFRYGEDSAGTNAVAVALYQRGSAVVVGGEHFADRLTVVACAATPVTDPATGRVLGAVSLTSWLKDASPLMLPLVKRVGQEIEQRLADERSGADRVLLEQFLRARRRAKGPLIAVNDRTMYSNTAAAAIVRPTDREMLWEWASRALAGHGPARSQLSLASGQLVAIRARPVEGGGVVAGALARLDFPPPEGDPPHERARPEPAGTGWASLTGAERSVAAVIAGGATNRQAAARLFVSRHTIDFHLRQIFRKLGIASRVELARAAVEHDAGTRRPGLPGQTGTQLPELRTYVVSAGPDVGDAATEDISALPHLHGPRSSEDQAPKRAMRTRDVTNPSGPPANVTGTTGPHPSSPARTPHGPVNGRPRTAADHARSAVTWLLVSGRHPARFPHAADSGADAIVIDLDGPATPADKAAARRSAVRYLSAGRPAYVLLNRPASAALSQDLAALADAGPALRGVILPWSERPEQFAPLDRLLPPGAIAVALIQSPLGLLTAHEIARAPRVIRLAFGPAGFGAGTGTGGQQSELLGARSLLVLTSGSERLSGPVDSPPGAPDDPARVSSEAEASLRLGFTGKFCLSPRQVRPVALGFGRCSGWPAHRQSLPPGVP